MSLMYVCNKRISDISSKCEIRKHEPFIREKKKYGRKFSVLIVFEITQRNESVAWEVDPVCEQLNLLVSMKRMGNVYLRLQSEK